MWRIAPGAVLRVVLSRLAVGMALFLLGTLAHAQADVYGTVTDVASAPVADALLTLSSLDRALQSRTADGGHFRFVRAPQGRYDLEIYKPGFLRQMLSIDVTGTDSQALRITLGNIRSMPDTNECGPHPTVRYGQLSPGAHLIGVVHGYGDQKPIERATVTLWRSGAREPALTARSDRVGKFLLENVPANYYDLRISRKGYFPREVKRLLVPLESSVSIDLSLIEKNKIVVCE